MKFNKTAIAFALLGVLGTRALVANADSLPEERKGAVIGGIIGASVGGPFGAGLGAILGGGLIGNSVGTHRINDELRAKITAQQGEMARQSHTYQTQIARLNRALGQAMTAARAADSVDLPIQFRTASSSIEGHYASDLADIATAVARRPDARIELSGFADRRGDSLYNQKLSEARVKQVRDFLLQHGVAANQIQTRAFGESKPLSDKETSEGDFFDRRVVMHFELNGEETPVAAR